jgi:hypothetical protein
MPPLGGPGSRRVNAGAVKRRARNIARIPKVVPKSAGPPVFPRYVPPRPAAIPVRRPTATQIRQSRAQEQGYKSQAGAVRRVAKTQAALGPGKAVRPEGKVLHRADIAPYAREQMYRSLGEAVHKAAIEREAHGTIRYRGHDIPAAMLSTNPEVLKAAGFKGPGAIDKLFPNVFKDLGDIAVGTPTSLAHLAVREAGATAESVKRGTPKPLIKAQVQTAKELVEPYKQLYKDPGKFLTEHPVTTALMVLPSGRAAGIGAGRLARAEVKVAGKTIKKPALPLEREAATLPGTSLRQQRRYSPDVQVRAIQKRREDAAPTISHTKTAKQPVPELHRRVDEFYDWSQQKQQQQVGSALRDLQHEQLPGRRTPMQRRRVARSPEFQEAVQTAASGAAGGGRAFVRRQFAREFGSTRIVDPDSGTVYRPRADMPEGSGQIYSTKEHADKVVQSLRRDQSVDWEPTVMHIEGDTAGETGGFAVVPAVAARRLQQHQNVGQRGWVVGAGLRGTSRAFRKTVLPVSTPWLMGQAAEGAVRGMVQGGGPLPVMRYRRGKRFLEAYEREHGKQAADELRARTISGGHFGVTGPAADYARHAEHIKGFAGDVADTELGPYAKAFHDVLEQPGARHLRQAYRGYAGAVFNRINAPIERFYKTAMVGRQVKREPLLENKVLRLSDAVLDEAARGMRGTSSMVQLGRELDRSYGRYSKASPAMRDTILHTTPFLPWFLNMSKFLVDVMPRDHPVATHLNATWNAADQEWRKRHRLSYYGPHVPDFLMGSYPTKGGKYVRVGRYMPTLPGDWPGAIGSQWYPQLAGALAQNLAAGVDWKGKEIPGGPGRRISNAALTEAEALIPLVGLADRATGLGEHYVRGQVKKPSVAQGKDLEQALVDMLNPLRGIGEPSRGRKKGRKPARAIPLGGAGRGAIPLSGGQAKIPL